MYRPRLAERAVPSGVLAWTRPALNAFEKI